MHKIKFVSLLTISTGVVTPVVYCSCSSSPNLNPPNPLQDKVFEFINERTFSIRDTITFYESGKGWYGTVNGTMWLFHHETDPNKAKNDYTYYALTNNHVTSGFRSLREQAKAEGGMITSSTMSFAYQNWDSAKTADTRISTNQNQTSKSGNENVYNVLETHEGESADYNNFKTLFTSYLKSNSTYNSYYRDMTICKVDFGDYANTPLKTRLDKLNSYANVNSDQILKFDDYSNISNSTIYTGGYPLEWLNSKYGYIYSKGDQIKFQDAKFDNAYTEMAYSMENFVSEADSYTKYSQSETIYNALGTKSTKSYLLSPDWESPEQTDGTIPFGGGASGSLGIRATDPNDSSTYVATGIYWGGLESTVGSWYFRAHFTPFTFNFGKYLTSGTEYNIIKRFYSSTAFTSSSNTPVNDLMVW